MIRCTLLLGILFLIIAASSSLSAPAPAVDPEMAKLTKAKLEAAKEAHQELAKNLFNDHLEHLEKEYLWSKRLFEAEREAATSKDEVVDAAKRHLNRMAALEKFESDTYARMNAGRPADRLSPKGRVVVAKFYRVEAELWLAKAKSKK